MTSKKNQPSPPAWRPTSWIVTALTQKCTYTYNHPEGPWRPTQWVVRGKQKRG